MSASDTIVAIATAPGEGGVGIVRLSGAQARAIGEDICNKQIPVRVATYAKFHAGDGSVLDDGISLYFAAPASFTGEDIVELQAHGGPVLLQEIVAQCIALGARQAKPGEFSQRAFLNGKLDLVQAEAIADLIAASDVRAARAARRSLDGVFSKRVHTLMQQVLAIRIHVEAAIDFADEPLETLGGSALHQQLTQALASLNQLQSEAARGKKLRDGLHVVLVGLPNAGKSSLLNALAGSDRAIVTDIAGTTRDTLQETVRIDGVELTLVDTAGLRESTDVIEAEGVRRARAELAHADLALAVLDASNPEAGIQALQNDLAEVPHVLWIYNKLDLLASPSLALPDAALGISAKTGEGLEALHQRLLALAGGGMEDGTFSARQRHLNALAAALQWLQQAQAELQYERLELAAEALLRAHEELGEIGGRVDADSLLGHIFSTFCIGK